MKKINFGILLLFMLMGFVLRAQEVPTMNVEELKELVYKDDGVTYVVNFWATWCAPCVKEMPYFEEFNSKYEDEEVKVILVSLDFDNALESRLIPFIKKKNIKSDVIHLVEDRAPNYWIPEISELWSGSIPATLVINREKKVDAFYEQSFHSTKELVDLYKKLVK